jgi:WD40 repeat protein
VVSAAAVGFVLSLAADALNVSSWGHWKWTILPLAVVTVLIAVAAELSSSHTDADQNATLEPAWPEPDSVLDEKVRVGSAAPSTAVGDGFDPSEPALAPTRARPGNEATRVAITWVSVFVALVLGGVVTSQFLTWDMLFPNWDRTPSLGTPMGKPFVGHAGTVDSVAIGELKGRAITVSGDGDPKEPFGQFDNTVRVWDLAAGRQIAALTGHLGGVTSVAVGRLNGKSIAVSGGLDGTVRLWDLAARKQIGNPFAVHTDQLTITERVYSVAIGLMNGKIIAVAAGSATMRVWDLATRKQIGKAVPAPIDWAIGQLNGKTIIVSNYDQTLRVQDLATGQQIGTPFAGHGDALRSVAIGQLNGRAIAVSGIEDHDSSVQVWDLATGKRIGEPLTGHMAGVGSVAIGQLDGKAIAVAITGFKTMRVWDLATGKQIGKISAPDGAGAITTLSVGQSNGKTIVVSGGEDKTLRAWNLGPAGP